MLLGSNDDYPFFTAVVATAGEIAATGKSPWTPPLEQWRSPDEEWQAGRARRKAERKAEKARQKEDLYDELDGLGIARQLLGATLKAYSGKKVTPAKAIRKAGPFALLAGLALLEAARKKR